MTYWPDRVQPNAFFQVWSEHLARVADHRLEFLGVVPAAETWHGTLSIGHHCELVGQHWEPNLHRDQRRPPSPGTVGTVAGRTRLPPDLPTPYQSGICRPVVCPGNLWGAGTGRPENGQYQEQSAVESHRTSTILTAWDLTRDAPTTGAPAMSSTWALPSSWLYSLSPGRSSCDLPTTNRPPTRDDLLRWTTPRSWANWKSVSSIPTRPPRPTYARAATGRSRRDSDT